MSKATTKPAETTSRAYDYIVSEVAAGRGWPSRTALASMLGWKGSSGVEDVYLRLLRRKWIAIDTRTHLGANRWRTTYKLVERS